MRLAVTWTSTCLIALLALGACGSAPKLPTPDEAKRHPLNTPLALELQQCQSSLQNARIAAIESSRVAQSAAATLERVSARQKAAGATGPASNTIFLVPFAFGSSRPILEDNVAADLAAQARAAPLVVVRGHTVVPSSNTASRIARRRVAAVRDRLVQAGVDPAHMRIAYQATNDIPSTSTRAAIRQVDVEVYRAMPVAHHAIACAQS